MKLIVGEYYIDSFHKDIIQITRVTNHTIYFDAIEDPKNYWKETPNYPISTFKKFYKHLKGYDTPLWKVLNPH